MTCLAWDFGKHEPSLKDVIKHLEAASDLTSIVFRNQSLGTMHAASLQRGVRGFFEFERDYKKSVEFVWITLKSVLSYYKPDDPVDRYLPIDRVGTLDSVCLTVSKEAINILRNFGRVERREIVEQLNTVPEIMGSLLYDFYAAEFPQVELGMGSQDETFLLALKSVTVLAITEALFVRGQTEGSRDGANTYTLKGDLPSVKGGEGRNRSYGWARNNPRDQYSFSRSVSGPKMKGQTLTYPSFLCFGHFTSNAVSGLVAGIAQDDNPGTDAQSASGPKHFTLPNSVWWLNHHTCPHHWFDGLGHDAAKRWRDWSVAPYFQYKDRELRHSAYKYMVVVAAGVKFEEYLLGLFVSICVKGGRSSALSKSDMENVLRNVRAHVGHERFIMMESLATEIAGDRKGLAEEGKRHGEMLQLLYDPINSLTHRLLDAIDDARRVIQVTQGPAIGLLVQAPRIAQFFEDDRLLVIGQFRARADHNTNYKDLVTASAIFAAVILALFGEKAKKAEQPLDVFMRARHLLCTNQTKASEEGLLPDYCRRMIDLSDDDFDAIEKHLQSPHITVATELRAMRAKINLTLDRLKKIIHTPAKEASRSYPWEPLILVLFGERYKGDGAVVTIRQYSDGTAVSQVPPFSSRNAFELLSNVSSFRHPAFLMGQLMLPVPRYNMLLEFIAGIIAVARHDRQTIEEERSVNLVQKERADGRVNARIEINFDRQLARDADQRSLVDWMLRCQESGAAPPYSGNFTTPFLSWAANCGSRNATKCSRRAGELFAVKYGDTRTSVSFIDDRKGLRIEFDNATGRLSSGDR